MNLLIVDDDAYVVEALQKKMEWNKLEIENVYTAYNVKHAKRLIEDIDIHIIVCDIEMPKENGFLLLEWVRSRKLTIQFIFLTSYAEFEYARKALTLKSFAYILKPVSYGELAEQILNAVEAEKAALAISSYHQGDISKTAISRQRDMFWIRYCINESYLDMNELWKDINSLHLGFHKESLFIPLLCGISDHKSLVEQLGQGRLDRDFRELLNNVFEDESISVAGCVLSGAEWLVIFVVKEQTIREKLYPEIHRLISEVEHTMNGSLSCVVGSCSVLEQLLDQCRKMKMFFQKNVLGKSGIYEAGIEPVKGTSYNPPDFGCWEQLFKEGKQEELRMELAKYIKAAFGNKYVSQKVLISFVMDFLQMLSAPLKERNIMLHSVYDSSSDVLKEITQSLEKTEQYLINMLQKSMAAISEGEKNLSVVQFTKEYIEKNLEKNITRESLAELVYLNPDYLARMFKRECGESMSSFLLRRRMETAKEELIKTELSINEIAVKVGYDNFSYFSKVFKDTWGLTPKEYRKAYKQ